MVFWSCFIIFLLLLIFGLIKIGLRFNISAEYPSGIFGAIELLFFGRLLKVRMAFAVIKRDDEWRGYYKIARSRIHEVNQEEVKALIKKQREKEKKESGMFKSAIKSVDMKSIELEMIIGAEDAAFCALICGFLENILNEIIKAFFEERRIKISPLFNQKHFRLDLAGILQLHCAQIIKDALRHFYIQRSQRQTRKQQGNGKADYKMLRNFE